MTSAASDGETFKAFEAGGWTAQAATYGELTGAVSARLAAPLLDAAAVGEGAAVLDVGTGPGYVAEAALRRGARPTGIDISEGMLAEARRRLPEVELVLGDAESLPFADDRFDAVVGAFVLNHLPDPERAAVESARVLAPGGAAAFAVWDRPERMRVNGIVADAIAEAGAERPPDIVGAPAPYRFADETELGTLLAGAGLREVAVEPLDLTHPVADADQLWRGFMASSVRARRTVDAQPESVRRRIREAFERIAERHRSGDRLEIPVAAKIASGRLA